MALSVDAMVSLFETRGATQYGNEQVSQLEHALQCPALAEEDDASPNLVASCLLHDLGHLLAERAPDPGVDGVHQYAALPFLRGLFRAAVLQPIRLHVDAKRYLCAVEPAYRDALSPASRASLELQGGPLGYSELQRFIGQPLARSAVRLRRYDDSAKIVGKVTAPLAHYVSILSRCAAGPMLVR